MRNPCATCKIHIQGRDKKKEQDCIFCKQRFIYAAKYGPPGVGSVPVQLTTYAPRSQSKPERRIPVPEAPKTKTCADPDCAEKNPQPLANFGNNVKAKDGKLKICKTCRARNRRMKAAAGSQGRPSAPLKPPPKNPSTQKSNGHVLTIDFSRHPDLLAQIQEIADEQERDPHRQIMFWLKNGHIDQLQIPMAG